MVTNMKENLFISCLIWKLIGIFWQAISWILKLAFPTQKYSKKGIDETKCLFTRYIPKLFQLFVLGNILAEKGEMANSLRGNPPKLYCLQKDVQVIFIATGWHMIRTFPPAQFVQKFNFWFPLYFTEECILPSAQQLKLYGLYHHSRVPYLDKAQEEL